MTDIPASDVLLHWPLDPPLHLEPITAGVNNRSFLVKSGARRFVLKWYRNAAIGERLRFEHELLGTLAVARLPFAVPSPVQARSGATSVEVRRDRDVYRLALFHHITGRAAQFGSMSEASGCGRALAILDQALDAVKLDPAVPLPGTFGDLSSIHAAVSNPQAAIRSLFQDSELAIPLASVMSMVEERWQRQTVGWKAQLIHGDFYPTNTMMDAGQVSGVLDFEFSGMGYRAMDFSIGMAAFSTKRWDEGCSWPLLESFATGYLERAPLTVEELTATPVLLLMREASSFVHWLGRMEQGLVTLDDIHVRARRLVSLYRWLDAKQDQLVDQLRRINGR